MGQAEICCHESEKAGKLELEQLRFFSASAPFYPNIRNNHCFRLLKTVVFCPSFAVYAAETTAKDRRTAYSTGQMAKQRAGKPEPSFSLGKLQKITAPTGGT